MPKHLWELKVLCKTAIPETIPQHVTKYKISDWWKVFTFSSETVSREKSATNFSIDCSSFSRKRRASTDRRYRLTTVLSLNTHNQLQCSTLKTHLKTHQSNGKLVLTMCTLFSYHIYHVPFTSIKQCTKIAFMTNCKTSKKLLYVIHTHTHTHTRLVKLIPARQPRDMNESTTDETVLTNITLKTFVAAVTQAWDILPDSKWVSVPSVL